MPTRSAEAIWNGNLPDGTGTMSVESGAYEGAYSFGSRFEEASGSNPEELIGAAHAGCYSMALSNVLAEAGHEPESVNTTAEVTLEMQDGDPWITSIHLTTKASVPNIDADDFHEYADAAKSGCPVSKALTGVDISLEASLV